MSLNFFVHEVIKLFYCFRESQGVFHQVWRHHRSHGHERSHYTTVKVSILYIISDRCVRDIDRIYYPLINLNRIRFSTILSRNEERLSQRYQVRANREDMSGVHFQSGLN